MNPQLKPRRIVDRKYLEWIRGKPCLLRGLIGHSCQGYSDAHHIIPKGGGKVGSKVSDRRTLPLCRNAHQAYHMHGREFFATTHLVLVEDEIREFNKEYDSLFPPKEKRERQSSARVQHLLIMCACRRVHRLAASKITVEVKGVQYYCPFLKKDQMASFRRAS